MTIPTMCRNMREIPGSASRIRPMSSKEGDKVQHMIHPSAPIWLRFLAGPDIDRLGITNDEVIGAVEAVVAAHGRGETVFEPRVHLVPGNGGAGHFNVLRGHVNTLGEHGLS